MTKRQKILFSAYINEKRMAAGLSHSEFERIVELSKSQSYQLENLHKQGMRLPKFEILLKISKNLNVDLAHLILLRYGIKLYIKNKRIHFRESEDDKV